MTIYILYCIFTGRKWLPSFKIFSAVIRLHHLEHSAIIHHGNECVIIKTLYK
jgi:hypothetical protein